MESRITTEIVDGVCRIGINRPDKRNALDGGMFDSLAKALQDAQKTVHVHCALVYGVGPHFSAGHDIAEFSKLWPQAEDGSVRRCIGAFADFSKPLIASVTGAAVGFGATMLLHADWVAAGESSVFRFPFANLGIVPEAGASALLARRVGDLRARDWLLSGRPVPAAEALSSGFVSCILPDADARTAAQNYAALLAAKPPAALQSSRRLLLEGFGCSAHEAIEKEMEHLNALIPAIAQASENKN